VINRTYTDQNRHSTYVSGPDRADVKKITGRTIQQVVIHDNEKPGQNLKNGQLQIYRPQVQMNDANGRKPAPSRVVNLKDVKRPSERNAANPIPNVNPANNNIQKKQPVQPPKINPVKNNNNKNRPVQQHNVIPSINKRKVQPSHSVNPPKKGQSPQPRVVNPSNRSGNPKQPQNINPPKNNGESRPSQPKINEGEKERGKRE
jgi:hypothetical protein